MNKKLFSKLGLLAVGFAMSIATGISINRVSAIETKATTEEVDLAAGVFNGGLITWDFNNIITITQTTGSGSESGVVDKYIENPRIYTGHLLSFDVIDSAYAIDSISITYNQNYYGGVMTAGISKQAGSDNYQEVIDDVNSVARTWDTADNGTHVLSAVSIDGLDKIYIHNTKQVDNKKTLSPISISINYFKKDIKYNVSFDPNGGVGDSYQIEVSRSNYTIPECEFVAPKDKYFSHWTIDSASFNLNDSYPLKSDITLVAQWGDMVYDWKEVDIFNIKTNDIVIFVSTDNNGNSYALPNDCGSNNPTAIDVRIENGYIVSQVTDALKWNIKNDEGDITFYPNDTKGSWLYCVDEDEGLNVGSDSGNNVFTLDSGYYKNTVTNRYMGVYNSEDWRSFATYGEFPSQTFALYKYTVLDQFSQLVLDQTGPICESTEPNEKADFDTVWENITSEYNNLPENYQNMFKEATPDVEGSLVQQAAARYDYLVSKYALTDFASRNPTPASPSGELPTLTSNTTTLIIIVTTLGVSALFMTFVLNKKRKRA